jgi:hypothetical protein
VTKAPLSWDTLVRRQFLVAALAAAVVLGAVVLVGWAMPEAASHQPVLRRAPDGSGVIVASGRSTRWAVWAAVAALVAVAGVLVVLVQHTVRVARFAWHEGRR